MLMTTLGLFLSSGLAQTLPPKKSATVPTEQRAGRPTLGFNSRKDVYPVFEMDLYDRIRGLKNQGWGQVLMQAFLEAFRESKECEGITFYTSEGQKPAFTVQLSVTAASSTDHQQTWGWWLRWPGDPSPANRDDHGFGGTGSQSSAKLAARDMCF